MLLKCGCMVIMCFLSFFSSVSDFLMGEQDIGLSEQSMNKHYSQVSDCLKSSGQ